MQGCHLVESHKSAGCGPVRSPETVLAREQENKKATKNNTAKTGKNTQPNQNQTKTTERSGIARQRDQLRALDITGPLELAHGLYDLCAQMVERNEVAYISPSECLSRQQEPTGAKPKKRIAIGCFENWPGHQGADHDTGDQPHLGLGLVSGYAA